MFVCVKTVNVAAINAITIKPFLISENELTLFSDIIQYVPTIISKIGNVYADLPNAPKNIILHIWAKLPTFLKPINTAKIRPNTTKNPPNISLVIVFCSFLLGLPLFPFPI